MCQFKEGGGGGLGKKEWGCFWDVGSYPNAHYEMAIYIFIFFPAQKCIQTSDLYIHLTCSYMGSIYACNMLHSQIEQMKLTKKCQ